MRVLLYSIVISSLTEASPSAGLETIVKRKKLNTSKEVIIDQNETSKKTRAKGKKQTNLQSTNTLRKNVTTIEAPIVVSNRVPVNGVSANTVTVDVNGVPVYGVPSNGVPVNGVPVYGVPANGVPVYGVPANGVPSNGVPSNGVPVYGVPVNGVPSNGVPVNGTVGQVGIESPFPVEVCPMSSITGVTSTRRVIERYDMTRIRASPTFAPMADRIAGQVIADEFNDRYTPRRSDRDFEMTPLGRTRIGRKLFQSFESAIFELPDYPTLLIKYQANCNAVFEAQRIGEGALHPLMRDYWYMTAASIHGYAIKPYFLSPPSPICRNRAGKCEFDMPEEEYTECGYVGTLRYMLMERSHGKTLADLKDEYPNKIVPFELALGFASYLVSLLKDLHEKTGIVHGDIHAGNILVEPHPSIPDAMNLRLIDFGRAFPNVTMPTTRRYPRGILQHYMYTHWQMDGSHWGPRDDIYKVIQVAAQLMLPPEYPVMEYDVSEAGLTSLEKFKIFENIFKLAPRVPGQFGSSRYYFDSGMSILASPYRIQTHPGYDPVDELPVPENTKFIIRGGLEQIMQLVRGMTSVNSVPPYDDLKLHMKQLRDLSTGQVVIQPAVDSVITNASIAESMTETSTTTTTPNPETREFVPIETFLNL
jgi:serine/threonine protein kinase